MADSLGHGADPLRIATAAKTTASHCVLWAMLACLAAWLPLPVQAQAAVPPEPFLAWVRMLHDDWALPGYAALDASSRALTGQIEQVCEQGASDERVRTRY